MTLSPARSIDILLVEDDPGDVRLTQEALRESKVHINLHVVQDGVEAIRYLEQRDQYVAVVRPDLILLDLNLPRMDGREVLASIKSNESLRKIPVVILTTSEAENDIVQSYDLHANCYITKPVDLDQFLKIVRAIKDFWFTIVTLPPTDYIA